MARTSKIFNETPWEDLPPRPRYDSPEEKYFMACQVSIPDSLMYMRTKAPGEYEMFAYREAMHQLTRQIADYFMKKHGEDLKRGMSQMVAIHDDYLRLEKKVEMGVYVLTPQEMDDLKHKLMFQQMTEIQYWRNKYYAECKGDEETHSGGTGPWEADTENPVARPDENPGYGCGRPPLLG